MDQIEKELKKIKSEVRMIFLSMLILLIVGVGILSFLLLDNLNLNNTFGPVKNEYDFIPHDQLDFGTRYGFYSPSGYFCVRTLGMTPEQVAETTFHELAHYYVEKVDRNHFCNYRGGK